MLRYFCRALQLLRELPEGDAGDHVQSGHGLSERLPLQVFIECFDRHACLSSQLTDARLAGSEQWRVMRLRMAGLLMLEQFLRHCGCIGQDPDVARRLMKSTCLDVQQTCRRDAATSVSGILLQTLRRKALTRAAASLEMAAENQQQGASSCELGGGRILLLLIAEGSC